MNYTALQARIAGLLHRSDLTTEITYCIDYARLQIAWDVRSLQQETTATLTAPVDSVYTLPSGFIEALRVSSGGVPLRSVGQHERDSWADVGSPAVFLIEGDSLWAPGTTSVDLTYFAADAEFTTGSDTRDSLTQYPSLWIAATMVEAALYVQDAELLGMWAPRYEDEVSKINSRAQWARHLAPATINSDLNITFGEARN